MNVLEYFSGFTGVVVGVAVAVALPILSDKVREYFPDLGSFKDTYHWAIRYVLLGVFSVIVAAIIYAQWHQAHPTQVLSASDGLLLGFSGESVIEKMARPKKKG